MKKIYLALVLFAFFINSWSQEYRQMIAKGTYSVQEIQVEAEAYFDEVGRERGKGYKPYKRWEAMAILMMDENGMLKSPEYYLNELEAYNTYQNENSDFLARTTAGTWEDLGPTSWTAAPNGYNPGVGRISALDVEATNTNHMIVGSPTGGVWRTTDGGANWTVLTDNLSNLRVRSLMIHPTQPSIYYWGSSSGVIFRSLNFGATWNVLADIGSGNVNKIIVDPSNTTKMYCSSEGGGIFKSTNGGFTWSIIHPSVNNGYDVEFKPGDPNTVYASGEGFFKSIDGGLTFSEANNSGTNTDGLESWTQEFIDGTTKWKRTNTNQNNTVSPRSGDGMVWFHINDFSVPKTRLVTTSLDLSTAIDSQLKFSYTNVNWEGEVDQLRVLYKTSSTGTWQELANYVVEASSWQDITLNLPNPSSDYYIAFEGTSNYARGITLDDISVETSNIGLVFSEGFEFTPGNMSSGPKMIGVSEADSSVVYVIESSFGIFGSFYKSVDSGSTFIEIDHYSKNYFGYNSNGDDSLGQAPRDMDIVVSSSNADDVFIAGINTWYSNNGGSTFTITSQWVPGNAANQNIGYCHADVDILRYINGELYVGSDGGVFKASNPLNINSNYYTDLTDGISNRQFYRIGVSQTNPVVVVGGSQDNGSSVLRTDGQWYEWWGADGGESLVDNNDSDIIYGSTQFGSFVKSVNAGEDLFGVTAPDGKGGQNNWNFFSTPFEQDPIVQNTVYVAFDEVYKSLDGGANWNSISQNFAANISALKIAPSDNDYLYLSINDAFWRSTDGGTTWTEATSYPGGSIFSIAVHPTNPAKVAVTSSFGDSVYITNDSGATWLPYNFNLPGFTALSVVWDDNTDNGLYLGMNYGVYYTDDTIVDAWIPFNNNLPNVIIYELEINYATNKLYAGTHGRGLWASNTYDSTLSTQDFELNEIVLFPNPAKNEINIKWSQSDDVTVKIYNTLGRLVFYGKNLNLVNGHKIDVSSFNSGMYYVKINSVKGEITKKLILK